MEHPRAILKFQWKLSSIVEFAGFLFFPLLLLGTILWNEFPTGAPILLGVGITPLAVVLLYVCFSMPIEIRFRRVGLDLLLRLDYFDEGTHRRLRAFLTFYSVVVIYLIILLVVAIFTPMSKGSCSWKG